METCFCPVCQQNHPAIVIQPFLENLDDVVQDLVQVGVAVHSLAHLVGDEDIIVVYVYLLQQLIGRIPQVADCGIQLLGFQPFHLPAQEENDHEGYGSRPQKGNRRMCDYQSKKGNQQQKPAVIAYPPPGIRLRPPPADHVPAHLPALEHAFRVLYIRHIRCKQLQNRLKEPDPVFTLKRLFPYSRSRGNGNFDLVV